MELRIGIDFGGVIIPSAKTVGAEDTNFLMDGINEAVKVSPHPDALEVIAELTEIAKGQTWIVSKAGPAIEEKTRQWLEYNNFYKHTKLPKENVYFCRERQHKKDHCQKLAITHFIDDRVKIMDILKGTVKNLYLFTEDRESAFEWLTKVANWQEVRDLIVQK